MRGAERQSLLKRAVIGTLIAFAFGLVFSLLIEVGIPLVLEATGAKKLVPYQPPPDPPKFPDFAPLRGADGRAPLTTGSPSAGREGASIRLRLHGIGEAGIDSPPAFFAIE